MPEQYFACQIEVELTGMTDEKGNGEKMSSD
jgi:hypothetical protein